MSNQARRLEAQIEEAAQIGYAAMHVAKYSSAPSWRRLDAERKEQLLMAASFVREALADKQFKDPAVQALHACKTRVLDVNHIFVGAVIGCFREWY